MRADDPNADIRLGPNPDTGAAILADLLQADPARQTAALTSGETWRRFCETLQQAGDHLLAGCADSAPVDCADTFQYLAGLVVTGVRQAFDHADPDVPKWIAFPDSLGRWGAENPDNRYLRAVLNPARSYRVYGNCGGCPNILFELSEGYMQLGKLKSFATMSMKDFKVAPNGDIDIVVSAEPQPGNWLPLHAEAAHLTIREYYCDWNTDAPAWFMIEPLDTAGTAPRGGTAADVSRQLADAALWIKATAEYWTEWVDELERQSQQGVFNQAQFYAGGAKDILYGNNFYELEADEVLLIEGEPPQALYWQFALINNAFVAQDYTNRQASLNGHQLHIDSDGRFRIVIAHRDPGVPNWLDTGGRERGMLQFRWVWTQNNPQLRASRVNIAALKTLLPADTPAVDAAQRRQTIARRQRHMAIRERRI